MNTVYVQRFKRCVVLCMVVSWMAFGFYPFGTPLTRIDSGLPMNPFIEVLQVFAYAFQQFGGSIGMLVWIYSVGGSLFAAHGKTHDQMLRQQTALSWAAPLAIFFAAGQAIQMAIDYMSGRVSGPMFSLWIVLYMHMICSITIVTIGVLHYNPKRVRE